MLNLTFLQYNFSKGEHTLKYVRMLLMEMHVLVSHISELCQVHCVKQKKRLRNYAKPALKYLSNEAGGILEATSASSFPRGRQQVNVRERI